MENYHVPVLTKEVLHYIEPQSKKLIVDGTLGDGGLTEAILQEGDPQCRVIGIDRDSEALSRARKRLAPFGKRVTFIKGNFSDIKQILEAQQINRMDGFLLDLGVSSYQLETSKRGFSFSKEGPIDMRMDQKQKVTASDLLETLPDEELERIFKEYGEERQSKKIVRFIRNAQSQGPIATTQALSKILSSAVSRPRPTRKNPATKSFQALRIAVNNELYHIEKGLQNSIDLVNEGGRIVIISFHSLESRRVKHFFQIEQKGCVCPPKIPQCVCGRKPRLKIITRKAIAPSPEEIKLNPRASSAKLRAAERVYE